MIIREYKEGDLEEFKKLWLELRDYEKQIYADRAEPTPELVDRGVSEVFKDIAKKNGIIYVAEEKSKLCGFIAGFVVTDFLNKKPDHFRIDDLIVFAPFRNKGIGKNFMQKIEKYAKKLGKTKIEIEVLNVNKDAYNFYKKAGFNDFSIKLIKNL